MGEVIDLRFGELPQSARSPRARTGRGVSLRAEAEALTQHPDQWAPIATRDDDKKAKTLARHITTGKLAPFADGKYETAINAVGETDGSTSYEIWVRYLGPQ